MFDVDVWARQVSMSANLPEDLVREALARVAEAPDGDGPRRQAHRLRHVLASAIGDARRLAAERRDEAVRLPGFAGPPLSAAAAAELYDAIALEVPEVAQGVVRLMRVARAPGLAAKVAVGGSLPARALTGALIGLGAARHAAIRSRVGGERVDIVLHYDDPVRFALSALGPAQATRAHKVGECIVAYGTPERMPRLVGRRGINAALAAALVGLPISVRRM